LVQTLDRTSENSSSETVRKASDVLAA
jgi:hypothetical protein